VDGCWKIFRQKCANEDVAYRPPDLPVIPVCQTPNRGSYYRKEHRNSELRIRK